MIFHENRLLTDDSHEISYLIFSKIRKDVEKFVVCCSRDWRLKVEKSIWLKSNDKIEKAVGYLTL